MSTWHHEPHVHVAARAACPRGSMSRMSTWQHEPHVHVAGANQSFAKWLRGKPGSLFGEAGPSGVVEKDVEAFGRYGYGYV